MKLAQGPHLTVRVIARRLLANDEIPASRVDKPDPELLDRGVTGILLPVNYTATQEQSTPVSALVDVPAGNRLARGRSLLPGLRQATLRRVDVALKTDEIRDRMRRQLQMYRNSRKGYIPDVFMARHEAVEDAMQRSAAGIRAARLMNHEPVAEPKEIEERLAQALMDDPALPLALEWTRQPRPEIPPPPLRDDPIWLRLLADAKGRGANEVDIESVCQEGSSPFGTTAILNTGSVPTLIGGPYDGWRLAAAAERRKVLPPRFGEGEPETAERYMSIELRLNGDRQALAIRPFVDCSIEAWHQRPWKYLHPDSDIRTGPIVGLDYMVHGAGDGHHGLGIQQRLVTPTPWISTVLKLRNGTKRFVLKDDSGPVVALITWRAEYDTTDSDFTIPRLHGAGLVVRNDAMYKMIHAARGNLIFRDFICRIIT